MKMNELKPKLFDVLKGLQQRTGHARRDLRYHRCHHCPATVDRACHRIRRRAGAGALYRHHRWIFYLVFGGSRVQIGGPTAAFVVIIYGIVTDYGTAGLTVATILAGIFLIVMGICHFGSLIKYIPYTITTGFTCGIAVTLFVGQLKGFLRTLHRIRAVRVRG